MKAFSELTHRGQIMRLRRLAEGSIMGYDFEQPSLTLIAHGQNTTFRLDTINAKASALPPDVYRPNRYLVRVHFPGRHGPHLDTVTAVNSEMRWLHALTTETDLAVPQPVTSMTGEYAVHSTAKSVPERRVCSVLRWLEGKRMTASARPIYLKQVGALMAQLHNHAARWTIPSEFQRIRWNWDAFFGNTVGFAGLSAQETWSAVPVRYRPMLEQAAVRVRAAMAALGESSQVFGLIHADLHLDNVLFHGQAVRAIDFDDCGFGYWIYDIAVALWLHRMEENWPEWYNAFLAGYAEHRPVPYEQLEYLDTFIAARDANMALWHVATAKTVFDSQAWLEEELNQVNTCIKHLLSAQ